ncbi:MAG: class A beta-lactamase [Mycobacteriaceae bacterium]|nr:class A beta-lactamase [Mycobacteriaceae bacterium]
MFAVLAPLGLAGCGDSADSAESTESAASSEPAAVSTRLQELERRYGARVGVFAVDTANGRTVAHRAGERFPILSTFKTLACGALLREHPLHTGYFDHVVHYTRADLVPNSPATSVHVASGMTVADLCSAAITLSDNTAGNQLLKLLGGPSGFTAALRSLGDPATRLDRWETDLNTATPGDERDTTTPAVLAADYRAMAFGSALAAPERLRLADWLRANTTGAQRIRAGVPADWKVGDKTGTGEYGTANDAAVLWPPGGRAPLVMVILTATTRPDAAPANALVADAARVAAAALQ